MERKTLMERKTRFGVFVAVVVGALVVAVALGLQAGGTSGLANARRQPGPKHSDSTNWSGYAVETNLASPAANAVTDVKGSWIVPTVNLHALRLLVGLGWHRRLCQPHG